MKMVEKRAIDFTPVSLQMGCYFEFANTQLTFTQLSVSISGKLNKIELKNMVRILEIYKQ